MTIWRGLGWSFVKSQIPSSRPELTPLRVRPISKEAWKLYSTSSNFIRFRLKKRKDQNFISSKSTYTLNISKLFFDSPENSQSCLVNSSLVVTSRCKEMFYLLSSPTEVKEFQLILPWLSGMDLLIPSRRSLAT